MINQVVFVSFLILANGVGLFEQYYPLADEIVSAMTLQQKIGQTLQVDITSFNDEQGNTHYEQISQHFLGSILVGGNGCPDGRGNIIVSDNCFAATNANWRDVAQRSLKQKVIVNVPGHGETQINLLLGTDAVHGNQHSVGAVLFPHNIGLAASHNVENYIKAAYWTKQSILDCGFNFAFAPTVAVSHNPKWGRFYETQGADPKFIKEIGRAYIKELQDDDGQKINGVLGSTKHYFGDGATFNGYDEGNCRVENFDVFYNNNVQGYIGALEANTGTIMVSYSAINELPMSISDLINVDLKQKYKFDGFIISDYNAAIKVAYQGLPTTHTKMTIEDAYTISFNSGMDMQMVDGNVGWYEQVMNTIIAQGRIPNERLNDAVKRILAVKLAMNLINVPETLAKKYNYTQEKKEEENVQQEQKSKDDNDAEYYDALRSAKESLVLLKNKQNLLPINKYKITNVILLGERFWSFKGEFKRIFQDFDNIGAQNGGWTIRWQGYNGNDYWENDLKVSSKATSILDAIKSRFNSANIYYVKYSDPQNLLLINEQRNNFRNYIINNQDQFNRENTLIINTLAENPYAEFMGDIDCEYCKNQDKYGCIYNNWINQYLPDEQPTSLEMNLGDFEKQIINIVRQKDVDIPVVTVLFSGRPMIITNPLQVSSAFVAAWWPGTAGGEAVVQALFGEYLFKAQGKLNTLPVPWMRNMQQISNYPIYQNEVPQIEDPLFEEGFGLETRPQNIQ
ncbi:unnamed protein product [Paramecium sonneborni]|uniref:beta-glucosidase n=1 Tax=Paramecium sonneborni TaxID=65129 RepID=A0A8S1NTP6_9CILI|nr:unnamed protein product [Paramecium sonneborni]